MCFLKRQSKSELDRVLSGKTVAGTPFGQRLLSGDSISQALEELKARQLPPRTIFYVAMFGKLL